MPIWIIPAAIVIGIIAMEWVLWRCFLRRAEGLHLHLASATGRMVFTVTRIRVCVTLHAIFMICIIVLPFLFLW